MQTRIQKALAYLNVLIAQGWEFPEACYRAVGRHGVKYSELQAAYDAQFRK